LSRLEANERARERQRASECGLAAVRTALDRPEPSGDRSLPTNS
jgi:hypothetical protein